MDRETKLGQADEFLQRVFDAACLHVQGVLGQDDGGLAGLWFSGPWAEKLVDDAAEWREPGSKPLEIPAETDVEAVKDLALANIAENTGRPVGNDFRDDLLRTFDGYVRAERDAADARCSPTP